MKPIWGSSARRMEGGGSPVKWSSVTWMRLSAVEGEGPGEGAMGLSSGALDRGDIVERAGVKTVQG